MVFGILKEDKSLDIERMRTLIQEARPLKVVCHKAFDDTLLEFGTLDELMALGVDEVLTSGHKKTAVEGSPSLALYLERAEDRIKIIAGGTVRADNVRALVSLSGVT